MKQLIYSCIFFNIEYLELLKLLLKSYKLFRNPTNNIDYLIISSPLFKDDIQQIFNDLENEQLTVKNTLEGIVCKINISLYKNTIWEQSFMPILEKKRGYHKFQLNN